MRGDSKFILPLYAKMMSNEKIIYAIQVVPDKLEPRDVRELINLGIPVPEICGKPDNATKDRILTYILDEVVAFVKSEKKRPYRGIQKTVFFLRRDVDRILKKVDNIQSVLAK